MREVRRRDFLLTAGLLGASLPFAYEELTGESTLELQADVYRMLGGDRIPVGFLPREITKVPGDYQDYVAPGDDVVRRYARAADIDFRGEDILLEVPGPEFEYVGEDRPAYSTEDWIHPREYLEERRGDCEDHAFAVASLLEARGIPSRVVIGMVKFPLMDEEGLHAVAESRFKGERYICDVSWPEKLFREDVYREDRTLGWEPLTMFGRDTDYQLYSPDW